MSDNNNNFGSFLGGFFFGGLAGAVIALLYAPQTGEETRDMIKEKSIEINETISTTVEEAYTKAQEAAAEAKKLADEYTTLVKDKGGEAIQKGQVILNEQKEKQTSRKTAKKEKKNKSPEIKLDTKVE